MMTISSPFIQHARFHPSQPINVFARCSTRPLSDEFLFLCDCHHACSPATVSYPFLHNDVIAPRTARTRLSFHAPNIFHPTCRIFADELSEFTTKLNQSDEKKKSIKLRHVMPIPVLKFRRPSLCSVSPFAFAIRFMSRFLSRCRSNFRSPSRLIVGGSSFGSFACAAAASFPMPKPWAFACFFFDGGSSTVRTVLYGRPHWFLPSSAADKWINGTQAANTAVLLCRITTGFCRMI